MLRSTRLVVGIIAGLGLAVALLAVVLARLGPSVDSVQTATTLDGTLINTQIPVRFTEPMRPQSVEQNFRLQPRVPGSFSWSGNELLFVPHRNLAYARSYTLTIGTGAESSGGRHLSHPYHTSFETQGRHLLYIGTAGTDAGRLILATPAGRRQVVGASAGAIADFSVSADHSLAVYSRRGGNGERVDELWLLNLADNSTQRIFRRPDWGLSQPHLSPDNRYVVFLATNVRVCHVYYNCYRESAAPLVYLMDLRNRHVFPFRSASDTPITNYIDFSPEGQIAYTDLGSALVLANPNGTGIIHIPNQGNALEFKGFDPPGDKAAFVGQTPSSTGGDILVYSHHGYTDVSRGVYDSSTPAFSASGSRLAYAAYRGEHGIQPIYGIEVSDLRTGRRIQLTGERQWTDWAPAWSLDSREIAFVRSAPAEAMYLGSGEIWVIGADGKDAHPLGAVGRSVIWVA